MELGKTLEILYMELLHTGWIIKNNMVSPSLDVFKNRSTHKFEQLLHIVLAGGRE